MHLMAKAIRISLAKFHCNRLIAVQDIQDYANLVVLGHSVVELGRQKSILGIPC